MFERGDTVVWRSVRGGVVRTVHPCIVVHDRPDSIALYHPCGTVGMVRSGPRGGPRGRLSLPGNAGPHEPVEWVRTSFLSLHVPGSAHTVMLFWDRPSGEMTQWYVNLEDDWRRVPVGFDSRDHVLDVVATPDLASWSWKDEDEFVWALAEGLLSADDGEAIRAEGERVGRMIERRDPPFCEDWPSWKPDATWNVPLLPAGWDRTFEGA